MPKKKNNRKKDDGEKKGNLKKEQIKNRESCVKVHKEVHFLQSLVMCAAFCDRVLDHVENNVHIVQGIFFVKHITLLGIAVCIFYQFETAWQ